MFCSTIIATIGRPALNRAVESLLSQVIPLDGHEIIIVNDSGKPLPSAGWQASDRVRIVSTNRHERCVARNTGAAIARGKYLHFLDDDDWLLPGALHSLWRLAESSRSDWLYGSTQLVDRQDVQLIQLNHHLQGNCFAQVMAGEWIPLQSSLFSSKAFFSIGGFNPQICSAEDIDLCRRIALNYDVSGIQDIVAVVRMGNSGSTTNYSLGAYYSRWTRETLLDQPGAWKRLHDSAKDGEWRGRVTRIYFTSMIWNIPRNRFFTMLSRGIFSLVCLLTAGISLFSLAYWRALIRSYVSETFIRGFREANLPVTRRSDELILEEGDRGDGSIH